MNAALTKLAALLFVLGATLLNSWWCLTVGWGLQAQSWPVIIVGNLVVAPLLMTLLQKVTKE